MEEAFRSVPAQGPLGPVSEAHGVFSNSNRPSTSRRHPRARAIAVMFGILLDNLDQQFRRGLLMPGVGVFVT